MKNSEENCFKTKFNKKQKKNPKECEWKQQIYTRNEWESERVCVSERERERERERVRAQMHIHTDTYAHP